LFELTESTEATLTSVTPRVERHGEDEIPALSLGLKITTSNLILDKLSETLRRTLYMKPEGQEDLPGVIETTPLLRTRGIEQVSLNAAFEGWTMAIDYGVDEGDPILCGDCKVDNFRVKPMEGGTVDLLFRVGTSDLSADEAGILWSKNHQEVYITITAPKQAEGPVIDGTVGHPGLANGGDSLGLGGPEDEDGSEGGHPDATDIFAAEHGAPLEPERGEDWPFPRDGAAAGEGSEAAPKHARRRKPAGEPA
jgi:hypothetical protein